MKARLYVRDAVIRSIRSTSRLFRVDENYIILIVLKQMSGMGALPVRSVSCRSGFSSALSVRRTKRNSMYIVFLTGVN